MHGNGFWGPEIGPQSVANANYANFAGTAYSVSGSNVVGNVANADFANLAYNVNVTPANSLVTSYNVALVDWIAGGHKIEADTFQLSFNANTHTLTTGNLVATSNVNANYFIGNGSQLTDINGANVSNVANANYANFAGTLINGTSNVRIPSANGNIVFSVNGIANAVNIQTTGQMNLMPSTSALNAVVINSYGNPVANDVSRLSSFRYRGTLASPLSVQPDDTTMSLLTAGHNGTSLQTSSIAQFKAVVDTSYTANGANIPIGWKIIVNDTNGGTNNQSKTHNFYSNGNVSFANSLVVNNDITSTVGVFTGNGAGLTNINGANVSNVANANYANFAGNALVLANGTSNINIPTASSNILISTAGNANVIDIWAQGTLNLKPPAQGPLNAMRIDSYGRSGNVGAQRISSFRYRGNSTTPLSVEPSDYTMEFLTLGYNGTGIQTNSVAQIRAQVDASYTANSANIPIGWNIVVNDTTGGTNTNKQHDFYSNGNVSFASSIVANNNITSTNGTFIGNGAGLTNVPAGNLVGNVANLNIVSLNTSLPTEIINTTGIVVGTTANTLLQPNSMVVITDYGNGQGDGNLALTKATAFVKARGDSTTPTAASQNDIIDRENHYSYNGTSNVLHTIVRTTIANTNSNANAIFGGGTFRVDTGNPFGDTGNANATSGLNTMQFDQWGRLAITQGTAPTGITNGLLAFNAYGGSAGPNNAIAPGISFNRFRGNRDSNLSLQPNDQTGRIIFLAANGSGGTYTGKVAQIAGVVDGSYVANTANVPQGLAFGVCDNTSTYTHNFYSNGNVAFYQFGTVTAQNFTASSNVNANYAYITVDVNAGNAIIGNSSGANIASLKIYGDKSIYSGIELNNGQYRVLADNVNPYTGYSPLSIGLYNNANADIPFNRFSRARGTLASPAPVQTNDQLSVTSYGVYADSGNTYLDVFQDVAVITGNDGAGNVTGDYIIKTYNNGSNIRLNASNVYSNGNIITSGRVDAGGTINSNSYITASNYMQANSFTANYEMQVGNGAVSNARIYLNGNKTSNSSMIITDAQFSVTLNEVNPGGFSPFTFSTYSSAYSQIAPTYYYRARGNSFANASAVSSGDVVSNQVSAVYADSGNAFINVSEQSVTVQSNDGAGNVTVDLRYKTFNSGSTITFDSVNTYANNFTANNVIATQFMKFPTYTAAALTAITGSAGWMACVTDSGGGGNPNGMMAFWDTTNNRWSYVHDNSAV